MYSTFKTAARGVALFVLCAALGFSYAIGTQAVPAGTRAADSSAAPRYVGSSTLRLLAPLALALNPTQTGPFDLGDALFGSTVERFVQATGGVRPYTYTTTARTDALVLKGGGVLTGVVNATSPADVQVTITVTDASSPTRQIQKGLFNLYTYSFSAGLFRFANDHLTSGILGQAYVTKMETLGAKGAVTFSVVPGSVTLNGAPYGTGSDISSLGLSLGKDGMIYGRPMQAGLMGFTLHATDQIKDRFGYVRVAKDRTNTMTDQPVTFNVENTLKSSVDLSFFNVNVRGNSLLPGGDQIKFQALINLGQLNNGTPQASLNGKTFTFLLGGARFDGYINAGGTVTNVNSGPLVFADGSKLVATVNAQDGTIKGQLMFGNLTPLLDITNLPPAGTRNYAAAILLENFVVAADMIQFSTLKTGAKFSLNYNLGKLGQPQGGGFHLYSVVGKDQPDIAGNAADAWATTFLMMPRRGIDVVLPQDNGFTPFDNITVHIGTGFNQVIPSANFSVAGNGSINYKYKSNDAKVSILSINPQSFTGTMITYPIDVVTTGLPQSTVPNVAKNLFFFDFGIDVNRSGGNASFSGEDGKFLFPNNLFAGQWIDRVNRKFGVIHVKQ